MALFLLIVVHVATVLYCAFTLANSKESREMFGVMVATSVAVMTATFLILSFTDIPDYVDAGKQGLCDLESVK